MSEMLVFTFILLTGMGGWIMWDRSQLPRFRKKSLLTGGELEFFYRLRGALPECAVFPQVAASVLIEPSGTGKLRRNATALLKGRRVANAVFDDEMRLVAVVELDYRTRTTRRDAVMDSCFASAGIRVVRFQAQRLPSEARIRSAIFPHAKSKAGVLPIVNDSIEFHRPKSPWRNTFNAHV
jgi:hypothetical protein